MIDGTYEHDDAGDGGYEPVEGNMDYHVGWAKINVIGLAELCSLLSCSSGNEMWMVVYRGHRPDTQTKLDITCGKPLPVVRTIWRTVRQTDEGKRRGVDTEQSSGKAFKQQRCSRV
ncbi:uncharacterized protein B0I36DRAFT_338779 [Microdochium trichocladiopsis]|uniref:Uncharacterized protein n=1 Tax=Microdochium trichocladiopsis TaxID=1682393 RepID=A0A9P8XSA0_9PEZI|nr:uncharacterized protein B0I36DRAFT_338779 [Microdochium trichocladiopsis]KAH7014483.1 hypothetical protein B0I36DRAFT_338779 [Microdochium trichocladiopsis]